MISQIEVEAKVNNNARLKKMERHYKHVIMGKLMCPLILDYINQHKLAHGYVILEYLRSEFSSLFSSGTVYYTLYQMSVKKLITLVEEGDEHYDWHRQTWEMTEKGKEMHQFIRKSPLLSKIIDALRA